MRRFRLILVLGAVTSAAAAAWMAARPTVDRAPALEEYRLPDDWARERLYAELQPVRLANCRLERFGEPHDGGYLMCGNLLEEVEAGYSYGIAGYDQWGCDISRRFDVPVHQYDCFDLTRTSCPGGEMIFHPECVAPETFTDDAGRPFDTVQHQIARNGHAARRIVLKIDVEGAEWDSLLQTPDHVFERIDQIAMEFHGIGGNIERFTATVTKLKRFFHLVHLHFNNFACVEGMEPFPAWAYEVLFVSRRLGVIDPDASEVTRPHPLDAATNPDVPDCQYVARASP